jgi:tetratricopeptide (TPR) repeat protein
LGEPQKALEYYHQSLPLFRAAGDRRSEALTLLDIGFAYYDLGVKEKALEYYNQAQALFRAVGDRRREAFTFLGIGFVYSYGEKNRKR